MKSVYRVLAYLVALEVAIQAAVIAFAVFGLMTWVADGGVLDAATRENHSSSFSGAVGFMLHGINGQMIVPLIAVLLLISSFFAKVPGGVLWAAITLGTVIVQVVLGSLAHAVPALGLIHGILAIALFAVAVIAARRVNTNSAGPEASTPRNAAGVA